MPHDAARIADTRAWLSKSATDLRAAGVGLAASPPLLDDVVFHCQQAVKTHSLEELGEACLRFDSTLRPLVDRVAPLTEYAWKFRYPGEHEGPGRDEAERVMASARDAFETILSRLPEDARP